MDALARAFQPVGLGWAVPSALRPPPSAPSPPRRVNQRQEGLPPFSVSQLFSVSVFHLPQQRRYETSLQEMAIRGKHRLQAHFSHYHHARAIHK